MNGPGFLETFQGFQRAIRDGKSKQFCHNLLRKHCHCEIYAIPYCDVGRDHDGADDDGEGGEHEEQQDGLVQVVELDKGGQGENTEKETGQYID